MALTAATLLPRGICCGMSLDALVLVISVPFGTGAIRLCEDVTDDEVSPVLGGNATGLSRLCDCRLLRLGS